MIQDYNDVAERYGCNQMMEINPDEDMRRWCVQQTITLLANADYYYTKSEVDKIIEEIQGMTPEQVQAMINRSIASKANQSDLETLSAQVGSNSERLLNTYTKQETNAAITAATDALAQNIAQRGYQTSGDVQNAISGKADTTAVTEAISEAVSGKADTTAVTQAISEAVSGKADTTAITQVSDTLTAHTANTNIHVTAEDKTAWNAKADISDIPSVSGYADSVMYNSTSKYVEFYHGGTGGTKVFEYDASPFLIDGMVESVVITSITSGASEVQVLEITWNSAAGGQVTDIPLSEIFDPSNYYTKTDTDTKISEATSGKADTTAVTQAISEAVSGKADTTAVTQSISEAVSGKQDTITAGRGISIDSANTISLDLPIYAGTGTNSIKENRSSNDASGSYSHSEGFNTFASGNWGSHAEGQGTTAKGYASHSEGSNTNAYNNFEHASGVYNLSNSATTIFGDSGNTLFSVGNGTANNARHNAFEIRQNGDIYITSGSTDIKLQDHLGGGGEGKPIEGGRGITVTTGATVDTVSFNLPISGGSGAESVVENNTNNIAQGSGSHAEGIYTQANGQASHAEGRFSEANGNYSHAEGDGNSARGGYSHVEGTNTIASGDASHTEGISTIAYNKAEHASGKYNKSNTGSTDADKTLFTVGNGTADNARHNAFEIRQNGDIYLTKDGQDVKLQDQLGGGVSESAFTAYTASTDSRIGEDEEVTAAALNVLDDKIDAVSGDVITISGAIPTTTSAVTSGSTDALTSGGAYTQFDGLKLKKLTQAQYDALAPNYDASTLYVIVN